MENMGKGHTIPKWVLINLLKPLKSICPNCLTKPKNLGLWWKKASLGVCSPWNDLYEFEDWPSGIAWNTPIQIVLHRDEQGYRNKYNLINGSCNFLWNKHRSLIWAQLWVIFYQFRKTFQEFKLLLGAEWQLLFDKTPFFQNI